MAFANGEMDGAFRVVETDSGRKVLEGHASDLPNSAWGKFTRLAEIDFSALRRSGRYRLVLGQDSSLPFRIGDDVFRPVPDVLLEFMRQQRCGYNPWLDAECHQHDGRTAYGPAPPGTPIDVRGGWHDAADMLKYLLTSSNATAQMLLAWEISREQGARSMQIPRSSPFFTDHFDARGRPGGNGSPDVLDEAQWGIEWMLKLHPRRTSSITRWPTTAIMRDGGFPSATRSITAGARAGHGWPILPMAGRKDSSLTKANRPAWRTLPAATPPPWRWPIRPGRMTTSGALSPKDAYRPAWRCIGLDGRTKASSKATPTAPPTATRRLPGPTTWNGARPSCFAPRASPLILRTRGVMPGWPPTNRGWAKPKRSTINTTRL